MSTSSTTTSDFNEWLRAMKMVARLPGGMPPEFRRKLWLALADQHFQQKGINWEKEQEKCMCDQSMDDNEELGIQIVKDLHRTGSSLFSGPAGSLNQAKLKRVLIGYARWNPEVGYCQGFNMLGALILQVMDKEDVESLKVMIFLIEGCLPPGYFNGSLGGLQADMAVFRDLLSARLPRLSKHLQKLQGPIGEGSFEPPLTNVFTMQWFLTLFCTCLPINCVLRVWDLVLIERSDILLRTALAIWGLLEERILATKTADDFYCKMGMLSGELLNGHLFDSNGLIQKVVDLGPIPELQKLRDKHLYNVAPWRDNRGLKIFLSDDEPDDEPDDDSRLAVTAAWGIRLSRRGSIGLASTSKPSDGKDRIALDISLLKKQYEKLRERQRQAHIILTNTAKQTVNPSGSNSISVNQYLMGRSAIVSNKGKRLGPVPGSIPPARKPVITKDVKASTVTPKQVVRTTDANDTDTTYAEKKQVKKNVRLDNLNDIHLNNTSPKKSSNVTSIKGSVSDTSLSTPSKSRKRSESSSYSEDSDVNSSTTTSLCDEENFEFSLSSVESSPLKCLSKAHDGICKQTNIDECIRSLKFYENDDGFENYCGEIIKIYDHNFLPAELAPSTNNRFESIQRSEYSPDPEDEITNSDSMVLPNENYSNELSRPSCSKESNISDSFSNLLDIRRKKNSNEYEKEFLECCVLRDAITIPLTKIQKPNTNAFTSQMTDNDPCSVMELESLPENPLCITITSTSQLSPIVDISKYLGNFTISPLRTPSSFLEYSNCNLAEASDGESKNEIHFQDYLVSDEGVTNEYFEIINAPERPSRLDLKLTLSNDVNNSIPIAHRNPVEVTTTNPSILENAYPEIIAEEPKLTYEDCNFMSLASLSVSKMNSLQERVNFIKEKSYSLEECTKDKEEFRPTSCPEPRCDKNNTDRFSRIIEENSLILHRILQKKCIGDKTEPTDLSLLSKNFVNFDDSKQLQLEGRLGSFSNKLTEIGKYDYVNEVKNLVKPYFETNSDTMHAIVTEDRCIEDNRKYNDFEHERISESLVTSKEDQTNPEVSIIENKERRSTDDEVFLKYGLYMPLLQPKTQNCEQNYSHSVSNNVGMTELDISATKDISETLSSIKNTIQNIDSLCQDSDRSKSLYGTRKDNRYATKYRDQNSNRIQYMKGMSGGIKKSDNLHLRISRDRGRYVSPRRRLLEDGKEEYESRSRRDISINSQFQKIDYSSDLRSELEDNEHNSFMPNLTFKLFNCSPAKLNKFEIRHTTVTSTFYDRFMSQKKERSTKLDKSPSTPVITKEYLESLRPPTKNRNSKSAENSPSHCIATNTLLLSTYSSFGNTSIRSCDNIPANLRKTPDCRSDFHFTSKLKKP